MPVAEGFRVATAYVALTIEEGDLEALIERAVAEACQKAGDEGGAILAEELAAAVDDVAPDLPAPLIDSLAGAGDAAAAEIADSLTSRIAGAGDAGGTELAASLEAATSNVGAEIANRVGGQLEAALPEQASMAASGMAAELTAGTATVGSTMADRIGQQLTAGLEEAAHAGAAALAQLSLTGVSSVSGVVAAAGAGAGIMGALTASIADAAAEAGGIAGAELARNLSESAVAALSDADFEAFTAQLMATASEAGDAAGVAAADALGAGFASASSGIDLIAAGLSTAGQAMNAAARAAGEATGEVLADAERTTLRGIQAYEAELDAVFESIYRGGEGMTVQLAAAMVEAFQGIEADTAAFTATELGMFSEFYQTLEHEGDQAALDLAQRMRIVSESALSGADLMNLGSERGGSMAARPAVGEMTAELGGVEKAAAGASEGLGGMAGVMGGPWLWGVLGAVSILPMFSGLLGGNSQAAQQAAQMHQQLAQAIAQDSGAVGDNTAAVIQASLAQSNLNDLSQQLGLTQAQLIEYAAGEADVQQQVTAAYDAKTAALSKTAGVIEVYGKGATAVNNASQQELNTLHDQKGALDNVTSSVERAIFAHRTQTETLLAAESSTQIYTAAVSDLVAKQKLQAEQSKMQADATLAYLSMLVPGTQAYTDAIDVQIAAIDQNQVSARINAQALNDMLPIQAQLSNAALQASQDYQAAGAEASAYKQALDALTGKNEDVADAQAKLTLSLDGLRGKLTDGKNAMNNFTDAGAKNEQQIKPVADGIKNLAEQLYKQTGDAGKADEALRSNALKLDAAAKSAGLTTAQIKALNIEFFGTPDIKTISIQADQSPARKVMTDLEAFIKSKIGDINATVIRPGVDSTFVRGAVNGAIGPQLPRHATGGPVTAGAPVIVGDGGRSEVFVPNADGRIYPSVGEGARALAKRGGAGQTVNFNYYGTQYPTPEMRQIMQRDFALSNRGGLNG
jgi:hypothetical protein